MTRGQRIALKAVLSCAGAACIIVSLPICMFGSLGLLGPIADVGVNEHRMIVAQLLGMGFGGAAIGGVLLWIALRLRPPAGHCPNCDYDLTGIYGVCPECGSGQPGQGATPAKGTDDV